MNVLLSTLYTLLQLSILASAQLDPDSPECAKGYAFSLVSVASVQVNGAKSTAIVQLQYTANINSIAGKAMTICVGGSSANTIISCTKSVVGQQFVGVTAATSQIQELTWLYGWAALAGCTSSKSTTRSTKGYPTVQTFPAMQYQGEFVQYRGKCIVRSGNGVKLDVCSNPNVLRYYADDKTFRARDGSCYQLNGNPAYSQCVFTNAGQAFFTQQWSQNADRLKNLAANQCLEVQANGNVKGVNCNGNDGWVRFG